MPYPSQIDRHTIITTARQMIEADGADNLSLRNLADSLGVKAPSLYRYVKNKTALLRAINEQTIREMAHQLYDVADSDLPASERAIAIAKAFRQFAHDNPACYIMSSSTPQDETRPEPEERESLVLPLQAIFAEIVGQDDSLAAIRGAYAFIHGWVMLELTQQLERGGDLSAHFERSFRAYLAGW